MQVLVISGVAMKGLKQQDNSKPYSLYCVIKAVDYMFCSKSRQLSTRDWTQLIGKKDNLQIQLSYAHNLFKFQLWAYDTQSKVGEMNISNTELPANNDGEKQIPLLNKDIQIKFIYERKYKQQSNQESERGNLKVNYNKSDPNLKISLKSGGVNLRKVNSPMQQIQPFGKCDINTLGRWKFIPVRNESNPHKLRL